MHGKVYLIMSSFTWKCFCSFRGDCIVMNNLCVCILSHVLGRCCKTNIISSFIHLEDHRHSHNSQKYMHLYVMPNCVILFSYMNYFYFRCYNTGKNPGQSSERRSTEHVNLKYLLSVESLHLHHLQLLCYVVPHMDVQ